MINAFISSIHGLGEEYDDYGSVRGNGKILHLNNGCEVGKKVCFVDGKVCPFSLSKPYERKACIKDKCILFDINEQDCLVHLNLKEMWRRL